MYFKPFWKRQFGCVCNFSLGAEFRVIMYNNSLKPRLPETNIMAWHKIKNSVCNLGMNFLQQPFPFDWKFILQVKFIIFCKLWLFSSLFSFSHNLLIYNYLFLIDITNRNKFTFFYEKFVIVFCCTLCFCLLLLFV